MHRGLPHEAVNYEGRLCFEGFSDISAENRLVEEYTISQELGIKESKKLLFRKADLLCIASKKWLLE